MLSFAPQINGRSSFTALTCNGLNDLTSLAALAEANSRTIQSDFSRRLKIMRSMAADVAAGNSEDELGATIHASYSALVTARRIASSALVDY
jgi:hypothetical protein